MNFLDFMYYIKKEMTKYKVKVSLINKEQLKYLNTDSYCSGYFIDNPLKYVIATRKTAIKSFLFQFTNTAIFYSGKKNPRSGLTKK